MNRAFKLLVPFLFILIISIPVYGEGVVEISEVLADEEDTEEVKLSLQGAIDFALLNSKDLELTKLELQKSEVQYKQNKKSVNEAKEIFEMNIPVPRTYDITPDEVVNKAMIKNGASLRQVELAWNIANWNLEKKQNEIRYNVEKAYFDLKRAEQELIIAEENLEISKKQFEFGKIRLQVGLMSKQQVLGFELALAQAQSEYDGASMGYSLHEMSFKTILGLPLSTEVVLTDIVDIKTYEPIILEDSIKLALENNANLKTVDETHEIQKLILKATSGRFPSITFRYREQAVEVAKAELNLLSVKTAVEMGVRSSYLGLITAEKQIETFKLAVQQATEALRIAELSFELGQNTPTEIAQANINLMNAKKSLAQQIHAYNLALLDFEYSTGIGK
jgi:outer membrane protein TolC